MAQSAGQKRTLYTPQLLALSAQLAEFPLTGEFSQKGEARSRTCGSTIELGVECGADDTITRIGMQVTACAIGQSSAAIMAQGAIGRPAGYIAACLQGLEAWLAKEGDLPDWPAIDALAPARDHPGRHGALLLPWTAMQRALSSAPSCG